MVFEEVSVILRGIELGIMCNNLYIAYKLWLCVLLYACFASFMCFPLYLKELTWVCLQIFLAAIALVLDYHLALWYAIAFLGMSAVISFNWSCLKLSQLLMHLSCFFMTVIYIIAQQPAYEGFGKLMLNSNEVHSFLFYFDFVSLPLSL